MFKYLDASARIANYNNRFPRPLLLITEGDDEVAEQHDANVRDHGW